MRLIGKALAFLKVQLKVMTSTNELRSVEIILETVSAEKRRIELVLASEPYTKFSFTSAIAPLGLPKDVVAEYPDVDAAMDATEAAILSGIILGSRVASNRDSTAFKLIKVAGKWSRFDTLSLASAAAMAVCKLAGKEMGTINLEDGWIYVVEKGAL